VTAFVIAMVAPPGFVDPCTSFQGNRHAVSEANEYG
jgi:hypothetical protein